MRKHENCLEIIGCGFKSKPNVLWFKRACNKHKSALQRGGSLLSEVLKGKSHLRNLTFEKGKGKCTWQKKGEWI